MYWDSSINSDNSLSLSNTCRICINNESQCGLFTMNVSLKDILSQMFSILIDDENDWKICVSCLKSIEKAAQFREMAKKSDEQIRQFLIQESQRTPCPMTGDDSTMTEQPENFSYDAQFESTNNDDSEPGTFEPLVQLEVKREVKAGDDDDDDVNYIDSTEEETLVTERPPPMVRIFSAKNKKQHIVPVPMKMEGNVIPKMRAKTKPTWRCCGTLFADRFAYRSHHISAHQVKQDITCNICRKTFKTKNGLSIHKTREHGQQKTPQNVCNICGKQYSGHSGVHYHKKVKHPELFK